MSFDDKTAGAAQKETFSLGQVRRVAAMLDIDPQQFSDGDSLPRGWHFAMLAGETTRRSLRPDGYPGLGVPMPQLDRPRLLLGQRSMSFQADLRIGMPVLRQSAISSIIEKTGRNGPLSIVKIDHSLTPADADGTAVIEAQVFYLSGHPTGPHSKAPAVLPDLPPDCPRMVVTPDNVMLFQYSALGFNTHRIHFDRDYARNVEGHPDLVVNGGLATLLATEFLRTGLGRMLHSVTAKHLAPLYVNRPMTILADIATGRVQILDSDGGVAADLVVILT